MCIVYIQLPAKDKITPKITPANKYTARCYCRLGRGRRQDPSYGLSNVQLNRHEESLLCCIVDPIDIQVGFDDIAGCLEIKQRLADIITPVQPDGRPRSSEIVSVLMHGEPGCGKTMLAKVWLWLCTVPFVIAGDQNMYVVVCMHVVYT